MAGKSGLWITVVVVALGGTLLVLSQNRGKVVVPVQEEAVVPEKVSAITIKATSIPVADAVAPKGIKPIHLPETGVKASPHVASSILDVPNAVRARDAYAIQVFSFKDKARAEASLKKLKDKGYAAYVLMSDLGPRGIFYRVRVGSFATEEEARNNVSAVRRDFESGNIVAE